MLKPQPRDPSEPTRRGFVIKWITAHQSYDADDCLLWPFAVDRQGYGRLRLRGKHAAAHRVMCELRNGPPPIPTMQAAHTCGNGGNGCCNPRHLRWATRKENEADKKAHGTDNRGPRHGMSKLTLEDVRRIRLMNDRPCVETARLFGVTPQTISKILRGSRWGWA